MFEALACGIPLVSAPWPDVEHLFKPGRGYLVARDGAQMRMALHDVVNDPGMAAELTAHGLHTLQSRHTCAHRVQELLSILDQLAAPVTAATRSTAHA